MMNGKRDLKKLLLRLLFIALCFCLVWLCFALMPPLDYADQDAADYIRQERFAEARHSPAYGTVFLGDSFANCIYVPNFFHGRCANLSLGGGCPLYSYYILKHFLESNEAPSACYITFSDQTLVREGNFLTTTSKCLFSFQEALEVKKSLGSYGVAELTDSPYPLFEYYFFSPRVYQLSWLRGIVSNRRKINAARVRHADVQGGAYMQPVTVPFGTDTERKERFSVAPVNDDYVRKMIELCRDRGIRVRIIKTPSHPGISFTEGYRCDFASYYAGLEADYPGITVDWFEHGLGEDCFVDNIGHVTLKGSYIFSSLLEQRYPEDFDRSVPLSADLQEGLDGYRAYGFNPEEVGLPGPLVDSYDD